MLMPNVKLNGPSNEMVPTTDNSDDMKYTRIYTVLYLIFDLTLGRTTRFSFETD